ncbi:hypothetical protein DSO57_1025871 [Entomophthora muscae]|uniref:Uncharacterized protein n=1 Tax=Entomophthora muscae TaxID=34485 RepID=A0ACC2T2B4_9FUNG|nr:hypothetical protein DSO57_1025871 [Entomophthora muscae]
MNYELLDKLVVLVVTLGIIFNLVTIYLVVRQGFRQIDMWLAMVMTGCDVLVVAYKIMETVYVVISKNNPMDDNKFGQWHGALITFLLQMSAACVGYLALLRFWVIFLRRRINTRWWCVGFLLPQLLVFLSLVVVAKKEKFTLKENKRFYYPDLFEKDAWVVACRVILMLSHLMTVLAVNACYPCIAWRYVFDLRHFQGIGFRSRVEVRALQMQKVKVLVKILAMVLTYNVVMMPLLVLLIAEISTQKQLSSTLDDVVVLTMCSITAVNPLMLLVLHHETWRELKSTASRIKNKLFPPPSMPTSKAS